MNVEEIFDEIDEKKKEVEKIKEKLDRMEGTMAMEAFGVRVKGLRVCRTGKGKQVNMVLEVLGHEVQVGLLLGDESEPEEVRGVWPKERDGRGLC